MSLVADPTPAWDVGSEPMTDSVHGASDNATPTPIMMKGTKQSRYVPVTLVRDKRAKAKATRARPTVTTALVPIARATSTESGAMMSSAAATGMIRTPAASGL